MGSSPHGHVAQSFQREKNRATWGEAPPPTTMAVSALLKQVDTMPSNRGNDVLPFRQKTALRITILSAVVVVVRSGRFELPTPALGERCSIP